MFGILWPEAGSLVEENGPEQKELLVAREGAHLPVVVRSSGHFSVFVSCQRPELPSPDRFAMAQVKNWIKVIVRDDILLSRLAVKRKQDKADLVAKQPVFEAPVKGNERGVVQVRVGRALLKIKRKQGESFLGIF